MEKQEWVIRDFVKCLKSRFQPLNSIIQPSPWEGLRSPMRIPADDDQEPRVTGLFCPPPWESWLSDSVGNMV